MSIGSLTLDPDNARLHGDRSIEVISQSLDTFGQKKPVVVRKQGMIVVAGNGTVEAARKLGWTHVAANVSEMTDSEAMGYALADNKSALESEWNNEVLGRQTRLLAEMGLAAVGFSTDELERLRTSGEFSSPDQFPEVDENIETEHVCPKCGYQFSGGEIVQVGGEDAQEEE